MPALRQVNVFSTDPLLGNPVAVVLGADHLSTERMQQFASWTNLSETTFVTDPTDPGADYAVRIFTPTEELSFAGHPTLGSCHAWLEHGGVPRSPDRIVQQCGVGRVEIRSDAGRLAFAAPPLIRSGRVDDDLLARLTAGLGLEPADVVAAAWVDNGPGWVGLLLSDAEHVLAVEPGDLPVADVGIAGPLPAGGPQDPSFEVRAFFRVNGETREDPITGSLNASLAQWFLAEGIARAPYRTRQGTRLGRQGDVFVDQDDPNGPVWIGGVTATVLRGSAAL